MRSVVSIAGLPVALEADDLVRWAAMDAVFALCAPSTAAPVITIRFDGDLPDTPAGEPDAEDFGLQKWFANGAIANRHDLGVAAVVGDDMIHVGAAPDAVDVKRGFRLSAQHALMEAMASKGRFALHAAVISRDNRAIVAIGGMGAGKSTLCYAATTAGFDVFTDDIAWIHQRHDELDVGGLPKPLNVPRDIVDEPPDGAIAMPGDPRNRLTMPPHYLRSEGSSTLAGVVFIGHSDGQGRIEPLPNGPRSVGQVMRVYPLAGTPERHRAFFPLAVRITRLPFFAVLHDAVPRRRAAVASDLLREVFATAH
jgi:hypothetical protein